MATQDHANDLKPVDAATCEKCGRFGALELNEHWLCEDCLAVCGSCCPEFEDEEAPNASGQEQP